MRNETYLIDAAEVPRFASGGPFFDQVEVFLGAEADDRLCPFPGMESKVGEGLREPPFPTCSTTHPTAHTHARARARATANCSHESAPGST